MTAAPASNAVQAVLFDLDETLFDHEGSSAQAVAHWLADRDISVTSEILDAWFASERARFDEYTDGLVSFEQQRRNRMVDLMFAVGLEIPRDLDRLDTLFHEYIRLYELDWHLFPDARAAVVAARDAGYRVGILTNGQVQQQMAKIIRTGLADVFDEVAISEALGASKPSARAFEAACELYGFAPATTCMVGDNHAADVLGARRAGMRAIYVNRRGAPIHDAHTVTDLTTIVPTIQELP